MESVGAEICRGHQPRRILLATDLSCRCDRAQDRAGRLAARWGATLYLLHVAEPDEGQQQIPAWRNARSARELLAERHLRAAVGDGAIKAEVMLRRGDPADEILTAAAEKDCDLIITGIARGDTIARAILGTTVERLVRRAPVPVLVVKKRADRPYDQLVVASDFSPSSAHALRQADCLFPEARKTLLHAYRVPFEGLLGKEANKAEFLAEAQRQCARFISDLPAGAGARDRLECLIEYGSPDDLVGAFVWDRDVDLAVVGTHGSGGVFDILIGSTAERLLECLPCDVLVVREPRSLPAAQAAAQRADRPVSA